MLVFFVLSAVFLAVTVMAGINQIKMKEKV